MTKEPKPAIIKSQKGKQRKEINKMMSEKMNRMWDEMVELGIATDEELGLAVALCGVTEQTLTSVLYIRTGYRSLEQMNEED